MLMLPSILCYRKFVPGLTPCLPGEYRISGHRECPYMHKKLHNCGGFQCPLNHTKDAEQNLPRTATIALR